MKKSAVISDCGKYRYELMREWDDTLPKVMFLMLNPSKADADIDDPTIRRCINFAKSWGYGGIYVGNLFAYRATKPKDMYSEWVRGGDISGEENNNYLGWMMDKCEIIVMAWGGFVSGKHYMFKKRVDSIFTLVPGRKIYHHLGLTQFKEPKHPLFIKGDTKPVRYGIQ